VLLHREVKMRSRGTPRRADVADDLQRLNAIADLEPGLEPREMRVPGLDAAAVIELHEVAFGTARPHEAHRTGARGANRRAHRRAEVRALVRHYLVQDGMHALRIERRCHARALDRLAPATLAHRTPLRVVVPVGFATAVVVNAQRLLITRREELDGLDAGV